MTMKIQTDGALDTMQKLAGNSAGYIGQMVETLSLISRQEGHIFLAYLLEIAAQEAKERAASQTN